MDFKKTFEHISCGVSQKNMTYLVHRKYFPGHSLQVKHNITNFNLSKLASISLAEFVFVSVFI